MTKLGAVLTLVALAASCSDGGVVGGRCRYEGCVEPGGAGAGGDAGGDAGDAGDAPADQHSGNDAKHPDADAASSDAEGGSPDAGDSGCSPPYDQPSKCGDCATQCSGAAPICAPLDGGYACVPACTPPLSYCAPECVDLDSDPEHCGACNNACPSGICQAGKCLGASAGHVVLLCMSFEQNQQSSPGTALLGNAVFLPPGNPVRVLAYDEFSPNPIENKVKQAIGWAAAAKGRSYTATAVGSSAAVPSQLDKQSFDVFLVYDQTAAPAGALAAAGSAWNAALASFVQKGGVVVVASGGGGTGEMGALIQSAGLLSVSGQTDVTGQVLFNLAPWDAVGLNVLSPFLALNRTCSFTTSAQSGPGLTFVVSGAADAGAAAPVVVHRVP
ncbi:MAG: hypothetical protein HS104_13320 [Polyangiaceae bacterium]|nr:hypothetical protein [Polyangiaceae bacterium]